MTKATRIRRRIRRAHLYVPPQTYNTDIKLYIERFTAINNLKPSPFRFQGVEVIV